MELDAKKKRTRAEVEQELHLKEQQIEQRLAALQREVTTVGSSMRDAIFSHPLVGLGGALVAGVLVGLVFGGRKRPKDPLGAGARHRTLVDQYVDAVVGEARRRIKGGQDVGRALRAALQDRVPLIVYEVPESIEKRGILSHAWELALRQLLPVGIGMGLDYLMHAGPDKPAPPEGDGAAE